MFMNYSDNNNDGNQSGGIYSKWIERLRNIRLSRIKRQKKNQQFIQDKVDEIHRDVEKTPKKVVGISREKDFSHIPEKKKDNRNDESESVLEVVEHIHHTVDDRYVGVKKYGRTSEKQESNDDKLLNKGDESLFKQNDDSFVDKNKIEDKKSSRADEVVNSLVSNTKDECVSDVRDERDKISYGRKNDKIKSFVGSYDEQRELLEKKGKEILEKIDLSFHEKLDELDVLESEIYLLNDEKDKAFIQKKIQEIRVKIKELNDQLNRLIQQYNSYRGNYYIDHIVDIDDDVIVDDLIDYRMLLDNKNDERRFIKEMKRLNEFEKLYFNLKKVQHDVMRLDEETRVKGIDIQDRDQKYKEIQKSVFDVSKIEKSCNEEILRQNTYLNELMGKVNQIHREEYTTVHLRGLGNMLDMSLRYAGLLLLSPFRGMIPGIGIQTLMTRRLIGNMAQQMHFEEVRHVHYDAVNYDVEISNKLCDIDYTSDLIDDSIRNINRLREDFMLQYDSRISAYNDTLKKINSIKELLVRNQNKVEFVKKRLYASKRLNQDKLVRVRELNEENR